MKRETGVETMIGDEQEIWEEVIKNATILLEKLARLNDVRKDTLLSKYISILFVMRSSITDYEELYSLFQTAVAGGYIDKFQTQKKIKDFIGNMDSALDYMSKFFTYLKNDTVKFDREEYKVFNRINDERNQVMHEGLPTIVVSDANENSYCCADCSGMFSGEITIIFNEEVGNKTQYEGFQFLTNIITPTREMLSNLTNKLIEDLEGYKGKN